MQHQYFQLSEAETLHKLQSSGNGLSMAEVLRRLEKYGPNELKEKHKTPAWQLFLNQFKDFMILILAVAAILSGIVGDMTDTIIILIIILLNAILGFVQEYRAEKAMEALKKMTITQAQVIREGKTMTISSTELTPGDIVVLESGNVVPADVRWLETHSFRVDESSLTGESVPVDKTTHTLKGDNIPLGDQFNLGFKGTLVTNGRAKAVVIATGMQTELGKIAGMLQVEEVATPLQGRMARFGKNLSYLVLFICAILFVTGILRGEDPLTILLLAVSLAVAAIPEALPALITIALSRGASRLASKNALIRKLPAVETLGSVTFICSDKTGTLTQNKMQVVDLYEHPTGVLSTEEQALMCCMALNHDIQFKEDGTPFGEPTELALVTKVLESLGMARYGTITQEYTRLAELPFDSDRKCMTTVHHYHGKYLVVTKGAGESIAAILEDSRQAVLLQENTEAWAAQGKRVLAYACKVLDKLPDPFVYQNVESGLEFVGLCGLIDPPREEAKKAIKECKTAGIKPVMITGDHPATARAIATEIGILNDNSVVMTGAALQQMDDETFYHQVENISVYARVSPDQKLRIVRVLQQKGHFVAMTGDGVNDAPSLKASNIGVAMGINGTDVSKEAAHLILLDDNFATIVKAVKEGRRIFDNIRKFVKYIMTCNSAEIWTIFLAPLLGMPIPLLPIQILWINLVTDGLPALALANEKAEKDIMKRPPRATTESLFSDGVGYHIVWVGLLMAGVTLGAQAWSLREGLDHWQTMVFTILSLAQLGHVLGVRSDRTFLYQQGIFSNLPLLSAVLLTFGLQMMVIYLPFMNEVFKTQPLSLKELGICVLMAMIVFHAVELEKWVKMRIRKQQQTKLQH
ncbi:MAG TPA: cation-translocating P-type ATPase [Saprospiraceae bacterium]|nr:cation-translocating P-type ATPase [Saprospiraceae bacterium]